jgi:uncharacterized membrane protein
MGFSGLSAAISNQVIIMMAVRKNDFHRLKKNKLGFTLVFTLVIILGICFSGFSSMLVEFTEGNGLAGVIGSSSGSRAYSFDLEFNEAEFVVEPKSKFNPLTLYFYNTGDSEDTYTFTFTTIPTGWSAQFEDSGKLSDILIISVGGGFNKNILISLNAPESGGGVLSVSCSSQNSPQTKTTQIDLDARLILTIDLQDQSHEHTTSAGKSTDFTVEIKNHQDIGDNVDLTFQGTNIKIQDTPDDFYWAVSFDNSSIFLDAKDSKNVILTVFAPSLGEPGDQVNIDASAKLRSTNQVFKFPELIVRIPKIYNVTYTIKQMTPTSLSFPNSTVDYNLRLFNSGNIDIIINLILYDNPENWNVKFFIKDNKTTPEKVGLDVGDMIAYNVQVRIPKTARAGTHKIVYGIKSTEIVDKVLTEVEILTNVSLFSKLNISVPLEITSVDLAKTSSSTIMVHNQGNGRDTLNISIYKPSIPTGWEVYFNRVTNILSGINATKTVDFDQSIKLSYLEPTEYLPLVDSKYQSISLVIDANKKAYIRVVIVTPDTGKSGPESITLYGESESGTMDTVIKELNLNLVVSNLVIQNINITPENPIPGEDVKGIITIKNDYHIPATNFRIHFSKITTTGPAELGSELISSLGAGETETLEFSWKDSDETRASYVVKVEITGDIIPSGNMPYRTKNVILGEPVEESKDPDDFGTIIMFLVIAIVLAIVVFLIIWLVFSRRADGAEDEDKEEDAGTSDQKSKGKRRGKGGAGKGQVEGDKFKYDPSPKPRKNNAQVDRIKDATRKKRRK